MTLGNSLSGHTEKPEEDSLQVERHSLTLRQRACDKLRQAIIDHRFPPGTRLIERDLCEQLGVSRTSVREALRHLESENLIEMVPHKGPVVATLSLDEIREIYEVRAVLEGLACEKFASLASDDEIELLQRAFDRIASAATENNHHEILQVKAEIYRIIFNGAKSAICQDLVNSLVSRIEILRRMSLASTGRNADMMQELHPIMEAARKRDGNAMKAACVAHVNKAKNAAISRFLSTQTAEEALSPV